MWMERKTLIINIIVMVMDARKHIVAALLPMVVMLACQAKVVAQMAEDWTQAKYCPGWNNPSSFSQGNSTCYYRGELGTVNGSKPAANPQVLTVGNLNNNTGINWTGTILTPAQMTQQQGSCNGTSNGVIPDHQKLFAIMSLTSQAPGHPVNKDPNTGDNLQFVPTNFNTTDTDVFRTNITKSIRIGDDCASGGTTGATAIYYYITPTAQNALLFLYYSIVVENPSHTVAVNPWFIIRVQYNAGTATNPQWRQVSPTKTTPPAGRQCDTLAYMQSSTTVSQGGTVVPGQGGWTTFNGAGGRNILYKAWDKVAINLGSLLYQQVRVEVMVSDCGANYHYAYGYLAGECRPMVVTASGCPAGMDTNVTVLTAPKNMKEYKWSVSEFGKSDPTTRLDRGEADDYFTFRDLRMPNGMLAQGPQDSIVTRNGVRDTIHFYQYPVKADDFRVVYRPNAARQPIRPTDSLGRVVDSFGNRQTFRVQMKSALDPSKPFYTYMYASVTNTKPSMAIGVNPTCDGRVTTWNLSEVPGDPTLVVDSTTRWGYYSDSLCVGDSLVVGIGDTMKMTFTDTQPRYLKVRTNTTDPTCYSEAIYKINPLTRPKAGMTISNKVLCDADQTTITDTTTGVMYREWYLLSETTPGAVDTVRGDTVRGASPVSNPTQRQLTRSFTHSIEPIQLHVLNGLYSVNPSNTADTAWCDTVVSDTVAVFVHPDLEVLGDTIVCQGSLTDATVRARGVPGCTYEWSRSYGSISGGIPAGDRLQVEPYADTSTYYVRVTSPQGCVAWDSIHAYFVRPQLARLPHGKICPGDTAVLTGLKASSYTWTAAPADPTLSGQEGADEIYVAPTRTTTYTMVGHGSNGCDALPLTETVEVVPIPTPQVGLNPGYIDTEDPTVVLSDRSTNRATTAWVFPDGDTVYGQSVQHTFDGIDRDTAVRMTMIVANEIGCSIEHPFSIPVHLYTAWLPTVFTPGSEDENAKFKMYTVNEYEYFHIYIYDRHGLLIFESDDPKFEWDGTRNGQNCVQGAYVYVCNYRKPGDNTLASRKGTITLLR